jgi:tRNA dimethylallyltransferase
LTTTDPLLAAIVGPTASGKTALSISLAERFHGEIVSCDSIAVYREFEIGAAKPSLDERARVPHQMLDIADPTAPFTAGDYARMARQVLDEIRDRDHLPIVVGGTGLYLRALLEGLFAGPQRSEELRTRLRDRAKRKGAAHVHRILRRLDPAGAGAIHPNDTPKVIRAIEVCLGARQPISELWKRGRDPLRGFRILRLGLNPDRNALYTRINERAKAMFDAGLVDETRHLVEKYGDTLGPLNSTGYKQVIQFLRGEIDHNLMIWAAQQAHRNYAKRQMTWFRREPHVTWLNGFGDDPAIRSCAIELVQSHLAPHM